MTTLVANVPPVKVWVRREYLRDLRDGFGEYTPGYWVTCKSLTGRALYFETYLTESGALFDKLPLSAFLAWDPDSPHEPKAPTPDLELTDLQFWNGFDTGLTVIEKNLIYNMEFQVMTRSAGVMKGEYLFTIDNYHPHRNEPDFYFAETPDEHKSHNIVALENGQIGAYPNNRCRMVDPSLTNHDLKTPDFKVSTRYFDVEHAPKWGRLGECDDYFWKTPNESSEATTKIDQKKESCSKACQPKVSDAAVDAVSAEQCGDDVACLISNWQKQKTTQRLDGESKKKKICTDIDDLFDR
jgi:hypothetical protein